MSVRRLDEEPLSNLVMLARNPNIRPSQVERLADCPDVFVRFNLLENPSISREQKNGLRLRENGRWANFSVYSDAFEFICTSGPGLQDKSLIRTILAQVIESFGAIYRYSSILFDGAATCIIVEISVVNGYENELWHDIELVLMEAGFDDIHEPVRSFY